MSKNASENIIISGQKFSDSLSSVLKETTITTGILYGLTVMLTATFWFKSKGKNWMDPSPPNPPLHPILGNILTMYRLDSVTYLALHSIATKLGSVFKLRLGPNWNLVVSDYDQIKVINHKYKN